MTTYELSKDAEDDLREIARYTLDMWGADKFSDYREGIKNTLAEIGEGTVTFRQFSSRFSNLYVTKYRYHYIFYTKRSGRNPIIVGVIHERRDVVSQLTKRLT